jgi:hypothetical protein
MYPLGLRLIFDQISRVRLRIVKELPRMIPLTSVEVLDSAPSLILTFAGNPGLYANPASRDDASRDNASPSPPLGITF